MNKIRDDNYNRLVKPYFDKIIEWRRSGVTQRQISELLGVSHQTLINYQNAYPELQEVLDQARKALLDELEGTLFKKAMGGGKRSTTRVQTNDQTGEVITTVTEGDIEGDTTALIFALKANFPEVYAQLGGDSNDDIVNAITDLAGKLTDSNETE